MRYFPDSFQMKEADSYTIECSVSAMELMERAAGSCVKNMDSMDLSSVCVLCGSGNNGGDGLAIGRLLKEKRHNVTVVLLGKESSMTSETKAQLQLYKRIGGEIRNTYEEREYSVIVDAIFGAGLNRNVEGIYKDVIDSVNQSKARILAVDIPSGICASSGRILGTAIKADITVSFQKEKRGTVFYPGCEYAGTLIVEDIGINCSIMERDINVMYTYEEDDWYKLMPERKPDSHKGTYGKLLVIAGSKGMAGAAYLNALSAYRMGAGIVQIYTHVENLLVLQNLLPEAIITPYELYDERELKKLLKWSDTVLIGSGIGTSDKSRKIVRTVLEFADIPCVIDADAINLVAEHMEYMDMRMHNHFIFTPHMKEMCRLIKTDTEKLKAKRVKLLDEFVLEQEVTCVLKDSRTLVKSVGTPIYVNRTGNASMAKAGSGDVLAGMISGLLVQGMDCNQAAVLGVYLHGCAGESASREKGMYSVLAGEIAEHISTVLKKGDGQYENI